MVWLHIWFMVMEQEVYKEILLWLFDSLISVDKLFVKAWRRFETCPFKITYVEN